MTDYKRPKYCICSIMVVMLDFEMPSNVMIRTAPRELWIKQSKSVANDARRSHATTLVHTHEATRYLLRSYCILGVKLPQRHRAAYIAYSLVLNGLVTAGVPLSFMLSYFTMTTEELKVGPLLSSIQVFINVVACSTKLIIMSFMLPKLLTTEAVMEHLDRRCRGAAEMVIIRKMVRRGNRFMVLFAMAYWSYSISTFFSSVASGRPPYALYNPLLDWRASKGQFVAATVTEFLLINVNCFQSACNDSYPVIYVCILRSHMKLLLMRIEKLGCSKTMTLIQNLEELKLCIMDHKHLINLFNIVSPIISVTIFIQFTITATLLSITLINITIFSDGSSNVASCFYILAVVVEVLPLCCYAQYLKDESNRLSDVIFHSNWAEQDVRFRRMLVVFMQRSQRTMEITAGKLVPITLNSFLNIAKFSFTLYTFIKEMGIKEKYGLE